MVSVFSTLGSQTLGTLAKVAVTQLTAPMVRSRRFIQQQVGRRGVRPIIRRRAEVCPSTGQSKQAAFESNQASLPTEAISASTNNVVVYKSKVPMTSQSILTSVSKAAPLLEYPALIITRKMEMMNILVGFEQANQYSIHTPTGQVIGYIAEKDGLGKSLMRNLLHTRRPFHAEVFDQNGNPVLTIERPFYFLNSKINVRDTEGNLIGETHMDWHLWRRRYDLFTSQKQFARIDSGLLSWDFDAMDNNGGQLGRIDKDWTGLARELFTDSSMYSVKMDLLENATRVLTYDERAALLAAAVTIDHDYFSRKGGSGFMPIGFFPSSGAAVTPAAGEAAGGAIGGLGQAGMIGSMTGAADAAGIGGAAMGGVAAARGMGGISDPASDGSMPHIPPMDNNPNNSIDTAEFDGVVGGPKTNQWGDEITEDIGFDADTMGDEGVASKVVDFVSEFFKD